MMAVFVRLERTPRENTLVSAIIASLAGVVHSRLLTSRESLPSALAPASRLIP